MTSDKFVYPVGEAVGRSVEFTDKGICGAEINVFLRANRERLPEGEIWCAQNGAGDITGVILNNGDRFVRCVKGTPVYEGLILMRHEGDIPRACGVRRLALSDALEQYRLMAGGSLSADDEKRYVYKARLMSRGLSFGYGAEKSGKVVSFAWVTARNLTDSLIGDVYTVPGYRGRGLASSCVLACVSAERESGRQAWVLCGEENTGFYKGLGFYERM